jgi:glycosyltransferase involved in cell wall biosynthesis
LYPAATTNNIPFFSIVVPTYNRAGQLENLIESIQKQTFDKNNFEVIVVNDGSTDNTQQILDKNGSYLFISLTLRNSGPATARNRGVEKARGEVIVFVDDDCTLPEYFLEMYFEIFSDKKVAAAGGSVENKVDGIIENAYNDLLKYLLQKYNNQEQVLFLMTNNFCCRKNIFMKYKGFNEKLTIGSEDREFINNLHFNKEKIKFDADIKIQHHHRFTFLSFARHHYKFGKGSYIFYNVISKEKHYSAQHDSLREYMKVFNCMDRGENIFERVKRLFIIIISQVSFLLGYIYASSRKLQNLRRN